MGDRVIHSAIFPCGRCYLCLRGDVNICPNGGAYRPVGQFPFFTGTYADYYYLPAGHPVFRVPGELSDDTLEPVNCAMGTVTQGLTAAGCARLMLQLAISGSAYTTSRLASSQHARRRLLCPGRARDSGVHLQRQGVKLLGQGEHLLRETQ